MSQLPELIAIKGTSEVSRTQGAASEAALRSWLDDLLAGSRPTAPHGPSVALTGASAADSSSNRTTATNGHAARPPSTPSSAPITVTDATFDQVVDVGRMTTPTNSVASLPPNVRQVKQLQEASRHMQVIPRDVKHGRYLVASAHDSDRYYQVVVNRDEMSGHCTTRGRSTEALIISMC